MENDFRLLLSVKSYYELLYQEFQKARHSIFILGWDIHSEVDLLPHKKNQNPPAKLFEFLNYLARKNPALQIYLLPWEYALLFVIERDPLLKVKFFFGSAKNIHFLNDGTVPIGSSHHQKIVLIDETVAYCGGVDLTTHRWDDEEHAPDNPYRILPNGDKYPPFHDLQVRCTGKIVKKFSQIVKDRWKSASGQDPEVEFEQNKNIIEVDQGISLSPKKVEIIETHPESIESPGQRETEKLYLELIKDAERSIYIETQYLTSNKIATALSARLEAPNPPQIVIILPKHAGGWLEQETMGRLQEKRLLRIKKSDLEKKLKLVYPDDSQLKNNSYMTVHSKLMLVDEKKIIIGSANLTNRSMGLDTECCLYMEGDFNHLTTKLLSVLSGVGEEEISKQKSLIGSIEYIQFLERHRTLREFDFNMQLDFSNEKALITETMDLERPVRFNKEFQAIQKISSVNWKVLGKFHRNFSFIFTIFVAFGMAIAWNYLPRTTIYQDEIQQYIELIKKSEQTWIFVTGLFALSAMTFTPINLMILFVATTFTPFNAFKYIMLGSEVSVLVTYFIGYLLQIAHYKKDFVQEQRTLAELLRNSSMPFLILIRIIPTVPNSVLGIIAGYTHVPLIKFLISSAIGFTPGTIALIFFQKELLEIIKNPRWTSFAILIAFILLITLAYKSMRHRFTIYYGKS